MATKMKMVKKDGKMVPAFAADGKGKMMMGGSKPKAMYGASMTPAMMQSEMKKGGLVKKQNGGATSDIKSGAKQIAKGVKKGVDSAASDFKKGVKSTPGYKAYKATGSAMKSVDDSIQKRYPNYTKKGSAYDGVKQGIKTVMGYQKGGAVKRKK